jgi:acyl-CoA hydrolase
MTFLKPVAVGDVVSCYARCIRTGNSSMTINVEVWIKTKTKRKISISAAKLCKEIEKRATLVKHYSCVGFRGQNLLSH